MWSNSEYIWPNAQRNWPNARAFNRSHLATVGRVDQMRSAFGQTRSPFGQMRAHLTKCCTFGKMPHVLSIGQMRSAFAQLAKCALQRYLCVLTVYGHFGIKTLRHRCRSVRRTFWHRCRSVSDISAPITEVVSLLTAAVTQWMGRGA